MHYFVKLNGQEFSLHVQSGGAVGHNLVQVGEGRAALATEIVSPQRQGRPALVRVDGHVYRVLLDGGGLGAGRRATPNGVRATINGHALGVSIETELERRARPIRNTSVVPNGRVRAPMPGRVVKLSVRQGDVVPQGAPLLSIEAMKMENELLSPNAGRVTQILIETGATVEADQELMIIEPE